MKINENKAGIYIHIPFCRKACHYCNFHFSTSLQQKAAFLQALHKELEEQKSYLNNKSIQSIYFGRAGDGTRRHRQGRGRGEGRSR